MESEANDEILTGVFYINTEKPTFIDLLNIVDEPLATLPEALTRPPKAALEALMANRSKPPVVGRQQQKGPRGAGLSVVADCCG